MSNTTTTTSSWGTSVTGKAHQRSAAEQLALLPADGVPVQLRLSQRTRRVGLAGVARARAILAEQAARRREASAEAAHITPPRAA